MSRVLQDTSIRRWVRRPVARVRIVCFPHAGGGAGAYRDLAHRVPEGIEVLAVQYPGREDRIGAMLIDDMSALVSDIVPGLSGLLDRPYLVFGHSMGSSVAVETIRALLREGAAPPERLVVSGRPAPDRFLGGDVHLRGTEGLRRELVRLGGTPSEVLDHDELRAIVLRVLDNDYRLIERFHPSGVEPLPCPVTVVLADQDPELTRTHAENWLALGTGGDIVELPGDHFYLVPHLDLLVDELVRRIDPGLLDSVEAGP